MLSERLLLASEQLSFADLRKNDLMRSEFFEQQSCVCVGKLIPNLIRDQDNLILEVMLPADLTIAENMN